METKKCVRCEVEKPTSEFHKSSEMGRQSYCRVCSKTLHDKWVEANKEKIREHKRRAYTKNPAIFIWRQIKRRSAEQGIPCTITMEDVRFLFLRTKVCPVLGIPLVHNFGGKAFASNSPSIDRIRPELGYVPGNVAVISYRANRLKGDGTREELQAVLDWMDETYARQESEQ